MKSVASVCQSMSESSSADGGVMNIATAAAATDTSSIGSFLRNAVILFNLII